MLSITRKNGQSFHIGDDIIVTIIDTKDGKTTLGIQAPSEAYIIEAELRTPPSASIPLPEVSFLD
tara:strand:- start:145 stop:339 length:195 start_codon:yes stop_codon:yes gene_type:complete